MTKTSDSRYDDILRRIAQRQREEANAPQQEDLAAILDSVNAWGFLEDLKKSPLKQINCYGPKSFRGYIPASWVGVVIWCKPKGYYHYETLTLLGIWAHGEAQVTLGTKALPFAAPIFNPESYYRHLKKRFDVYYQGDGSPPPENSWLYTVHYDASRRLAIRAEIQAQLARWAQAYK